MGADAAMVRSRKESFRQEYHGGPGTVFGRAVPELVMLGYDRFQEAAPLYDHRHDRCYEFVYVESGKATWEVNGLQYPSHAGQFFHTRPGERHRAKLDYIEPCGIWWLILIAPSEMPDWLRFDEADRGRVHEALDRLPRLVKADIRVREQFVKLQGLLRHGTEGDAFRVRHHLLDILLHVLYPHVERQIPLDLHKALLALTEEMEAGLERRWLNKELAAKVGVSESHFYRLFQDLHGQSPANYMDRLRMNRAYELLRLPGQTVTGVAMELGYKTSQHFATVFRKYTGVTPSQWRSSAD